MRKRTRVFILIASIWLAAALFDFIITQITGRPVLCINAGGGDMAMYIGLGYAIMIGYPLGPVGESQTTYSYFYWPCIVIIGLLLVFVIADIAKYKKKEQSY